jgi:predicted NAD/FAD-dependent oxidoreductase
MGCVVVMCWMLTDGQKERVQKQEVWRLEAKADWKRRHGR